MFLCVFLYRFLLGVLPPKTFPKPSKTPQKHPQSLPKHPQEQLRWRRMIRNFTIRNRDSRRLVFLNFLLWVKELVNSDCRFGFLVKNCIYSQLDMSRIPKFDQKIRNSQTLAPKSAISYPTSPPQTMSSYFEIVLHSS